MNNYEKIYWLTRLDVIKNFSITMVAILSAFIAARFCYRWYVKLEDEAFPPSLSWYTHLSFWPFYIGCIASLIFIPTQKEAVIIFAGGKTMDFIQADSSIQMIPAQTTKIMSDFMQKTINDLESDIQKQETEKSPEK